MPRFVRRTPHAPRLLTMVLGVGLAVMTGCQEPAGTLEPEAATATPDSPTAPSTPDPAPATPCPSSPVPGMTPTGLPPTPSPPVTPGPTAPTPPVTPGPEPTAYCPDDMRELRNSSGELELCVDPYEVTVTGELGSHDQLADGAMPTVATTASVPGVEPTILISYDQALAACAQTPVLDREGNLAGYKRMITSQVWRDACDGILGDGGSIFPYGDTFDPQACATLDENGDQVIDEPVPTGSFPRCVSAFGVYDLTGNVWEWADTGMTMDIEAWFDLAASSGMGIYADEDGLLATYLRHDITALYIELVGVQASDLYIDTDGYLKLSSDKLEYLTDEFGHGPRGYLWQVHDDYAAAQSCAECYLPVEVVPIDLTDETQPYLFAVAWESDGAPVADKRGGSFYSVERPTCETSQVVHFHDTHGTIGVRCIADPIVSRPAEDGGS